MLSLSTIPQRIKCIDEKPWGNLGFRKIRVKNYFIYFLINEDRKEVHIIAIIYTRKDQENQLEQLK